MIGPVRQLQGGRNDTTLIVESTFFWGLDPELVRRTDGLLPKEL